VPQIEIRKVAEVAGVAGKKSSSSRSDAYLCLEKKRDN